MQGGGQQTSVVQEVCRLCQNNGTLVCLGSAEPERGHPGRPRPCPFHLLPGPLQLRVSGTGVYVRA